MHSRQIAAGARWFIEGRSAEPELGGTAVFWFWEADGSRHVRQLSALAQGGRVTVSGPYIGFAGAGFRRGYALLVETAKSASKVQVIVAAEWSKTDTEHIEVELRPVQALAPAPLGPGVPVPRVAICMATFEPRIELFTKQIRSLQAQSLSDWVCLIQDDGSSPQTIENMQAIFGDDPRFRLETNGENVGFYLNFGRSLARVPAGTPFVALSDQDDEWYPHKLETLTSKLENDPKINLVYSDMRVVDEKGNTIRDDFPLGVASAREVDALLIANVVTGCSTVFRGSLIEMVLPLPQAVNAYHDHWIAAVAAATGLCAYHHVPLMDYCQHGNNTLGYRGSHVRMIVKLLVVTAATPALALAAAFPPSRKILRRYLQIMLNQTRDEYIVREAFRVTLETRLGRVMPRLTPVSGGRAVRLGFQVLAGVRYGSGFSAISLRLFASALLERAIALTGALR